MTASVRGGVYRRNGKPAYFFVAASTYLSLSSLLTASPEMGCVLR